MLTSIQVRNFAIIDQVEIEFSPGMTVLTGETGAGKSILVDAMGWSLVKEAAADWFAAARKGPNSLLSLIFAISRARANGSKSTCSISTLNATCVA